MTAKTVAAVWQEYCPIRVRGLKSEKEIIRVYERYIHETFGSRLIAKITMKDIELWYSQFKDTPVQGNRCLTLLRSLFSFAQDGLGWIERNPAKVIRRFSEAKRERHLRKSEAPQLAKTLTEMEFRYPGTCLLAWLIMFTGARPSEITRAKWGDIKGNVLTIKQHKTARKSGRVRTIVLPPPAMAKLKKLGHARRRPDDHIIDTWRSCASMWKKIRAELGIPDLRLYDLRHTFATYALEKGYGLGQIGKVLAHTNASTTMIYAELTDESRYNVAYDASLGILHAMGVEIDTPDLACLL